MKSLLLAAAALGLAGLAACDKSAQSADGAVSEGAVGTAANTPTGQVVPTTGTNAASGALDAPEVTAAAPADGAASAGNEGGGAAAPADKH
ncbi:hypothetical protein [Phenylobacterium sp.]|jgi:hypothetical protein|uniref:hypothetical protein n=1 Tax=Phenylobacterium sp. TaxID=1871053 RepID=UPI002F91C181